MVRKEFTRVKPEEVGIPSGAIERLLDKLESGYTEPHGLMIMRGGKICAEGWWAPYAPGIRHSQASHSKTYAATCVGVAYTEGLLKLDERIIDIFPEYAPENPSEYLKELTVHHVLCMGTGMEKNPRGTGEDWIREFLNTPIVYKPGTAYMYNSTGSTLLAAIVRKKTGLTLTEYLTPRLFDKIGIDSKNHRWSLTADGTEVGGGGMHATTEDNLRLLKLYANGGVWEGERILAEDYVQRATTLQNESASEAAVNPPAKDNFVGYGYQIWMCRPEGVYRADGAGGQFTIVVPDRDMIIAIHENANGSTGGVGPQQTLDYMWEFLDEIPKGPADAIAADDAASAHLAKRMATLSLEKPKYVPFSPIRANVCGKTYAITQGNLNIASSGGFGGFGAPGASSVQFVFDGDICHLTYEQGGKTNTINVALNGSFEENVIEGGVATRALVYGHWENENTFRVTFRWIETSGKRVFDFVFDGDELSVETVGARFFRGMEPTPIKGKVQ